MNEDFLHYLWKYQLYSTDSLLLGDGSPIYVVSPGEHNHDSGPDFFNVKIKMEETLWVGNVEIHVNASDWFRHHHEIDDAYDSVILHVVAKNDAVVMRKSGEQIPTIELKCPPTLYQQYLFLMQHKGWIPCESFINEVDKFTVLNWKETLLVERLKEKSEIIAHRLAENKQNWEETFYQTLAANFGFKTNSQPFEILSRSLPLKILAKQKDQSISVEALLFGQAGLLPETSDEPYVQHLIREYRHLTNKYQLTPMSGHLWKFMRMRPGNFPTIRLSQFAALIVQSTALMSRIVECRTIHDLKTLFIVKASVFWETHYTFSGESVKKDKKLGEDAFHNIVINTLVPFLFYYGKAKHRPELVDRVLKWLEKIPPEQNQIVSSWDALGLTADHAFDSQALIQLKNRYCKNRKCLSCRIGDQVIKHKY